MSKIKPWEKIPKSKDRPEAGYITRIGDSQWYVEPYEYGFVVAKYRNRSKDGTIRIDGMSAKYPSDIHGLVKVITTLGHVLDGDVVSGLEEAIQGQIRANALAVQVAQQLGEAIDNAKAA